MAAALRRHWPEYLMEAFGLGAFMVSACGFGVLLEHPSSPLRAALPDATLRRVLTGCAMGLTAIALIYSPWGKQSGAHYNPAVTLTFARLGRVRGADAALYALAQFAGGAVGVWAAAAVLGDLLAAPQVHYAATRPGMWGVGAAFAAELAISFGLMAVVLAAMNAPRLARWTGLLAGATVAAWIALAPVSGMSMNPARTFASAQAARDWTALWVYFVAPPLGMVLAAETFTRLRRGGHQACAKLHHQNGKRCIFCGKGEG